MNPYIGLIFDVVILAALAVTMHRAWRLSQQFNRMHADRKIFDQLIQSLNLASSRAEAAIRAFREAATQGGEHLQDKINKARALADELEIMIQAGDNLAERLKTLAENTRRAAPVAEEETRAAAPLAAPPRTRAEKELLEALKAKQQS